ncbi:kazal-type serine peptidase inhibitor domain 3 [Trichomycterus rosablanca]|uniref:kazal-type serine peptidase inhibitor domain 3 n=1 Tax=Trichomycterus rosablanca TaxID=2290929 RepID=UPI002F351AFD
MLLVFALLMLSITLGKSFPPYSYEPGEDEDPDQDPFDYYRAPEDLENRNGTVCEECVPELCPPTQGCRAGLVLDSCGCCLECGNLEGQPCDLGDTNTYYGRCGENLECRIDSSETSESEPQCVCAHQEPMCGSDGSTYMNLCKFKEAEFSKSGLNVTEGPCRTVPLIKVPPRDLVNVTGSSAVFLCEVFAFPMALVEWRKDGKEVVLPGDDPHISVQSRGGPQKYELSSWLQIEDASRADSGTYRCTARNGLGDVSATAVLGILPPDEMSAYLEESFKEQMGYDPMKFYDENYY